MAVSGSEPASVQDLGISLNGDASAGGIGSQPASVEDLQLVVQGMQEMNQQEVLAFSGMMMSMRKNGSWQRFYSGLWTGASVPVTGRYRVYMFVTGNNDNYSGKTWKVLFNGTTVLSGVTNDVSANRFSKGTKDFDLTAGTGTAVTFGGDFSPEVCVGVIQRIS